MVGRTGHRDSAETGHRRLDTGRAQEVVHPVLREGAGQRTTTASLGCPVTPMISPSSSQARSIASSSLHSSGRVSSMRPREARRSTSPSRARCGHLRSRNVHAVTASMSPPRRRLLRGTRNPVPCRGEGTSAAATRNVTRTTEAYAIVSSKAAASSSCGASRAAVAGAGAASTTASACVAAAPDHTDQPPPTRSSRSAGAETPDVDPALGEARRQRVHQRGHAAAAVTRTGAAPRGPGRGPRPAGRA